MCVSDATRGETTHRPPHVHIVTCQNTRTTVTPQLKIDIAVLPAVESTKWICFMEVHETTRTVSFVGGISNTAFVKKSRIVGGARMIFRACLDTSAFFDSAELNREHFVPTVPSTNGSVSGNAESMLVDYDHPPALAALMAYVGANISLSELTRLRATQLQNISAFVEKNGDIASQVIASGDASAARMHELATITTFPTTRKDDAELQHAAHVVAHWIVRRAVLPLVSGHTHAWFLAQEARLVALHLRFAFPDSATDQKLEAFLRPCVEHFSLTRIAAGASYMIDSVAALCNGIPLHSARVSRVDGHAHLTLRQVARDLLPLYIDACTGAQVPAAVYMPDDITTAATDIVAERRAHTTSTDRGKYLPRRDVDQATLPNLAEPTGPPNLWPLCMQRIHRKLVETGHIYHGERYGYTSFLLDLGYTPPIVLEHIKSHYTTLSAGAFDKAHRNIVKRPDRPEMWTNGGAERKIPYGISCFRTTKSDNLPGDTRPDDHSVCVGCPYTRLPRNVLKSELEKSKTLSPTDIEDIAASAHTGNERQACAHHFSLLMGNSPPSSQFGPWVPIAPRAFASEAFARVRSVLL